MAESEMPVAPNALYLAWLNREGKVNAEFEVQVIGKTEPPRVLKYQVELVAFRAARWTDNVCDIGGAAQQAELPAPLAAQISQLLGTTLAIPVSIFDNQLTFYIDPPQL